MNKRLTPKEVKGKPTSYKRQSGFFGFLKDSFKIFVILILVAGVLLSVSSVSFGIGMFFAYLDESTPLDIATIQQDLLTSKDTILLDMNGDLYATISPADYKHEFISYEKIKDSYIPKAFVSIEDTRFFEHFGIDIQRIASAFIGLIINKGNATHGGSTITQQVVKLTTGDDDISGRRKIQEWHRAVLLEKKLTKEAILEIYVNILPMSGGFKGVQSAAKAFFNKDASELTLAETALIAGIPNAPSIYTPLTEWGRRNVLRRMKIILKTMLDEGRITIEEYDDALNEEIVFDFTWQDNTNKTVIQSWFTEEVLKEVKRDLVSQKGLTPELAEMIVHGSGLVIETTVDPKAQNDTQAVFFTEHLFMRDKSQIPNSPEKPQAAITVLDNRKGYEGEVRAIVGGYGEKKGNYVFNLATDAKRQPGSSIKPLLVYAPALDMGVITPNTVISDRPVYLDPNNPAREYPQNYSRTYSGPVTVSYAVLMSLNTIAADVFQNYLGIENGLDYLKRMGMDRTTETNVAAALGGFREGMSTWEMAEGFSVLANGGVHRKATTYRRVLTQDGAVLLDNRHRPSEQVLKGMTAYEMTNMLKPVAEAQWNYAKPNNTVAAGKTGTTENYRDIWFSGYTPYYTASVWYGYENANGRNLTIPLVDGQNASRIWRATMEALHKDLPQKDFDLPDTLEKVVLCADTGLIANDFCPNKIYRIMDKEDVKNLKKCDVHKEQRRETLPTDDLAPPPIDLEIPRDDDMPQDDDMWLPPIEIPTNN